MSSLAPPVLTESSFLQVTNTTIKSQMVSKFSKIQPGTVELMSLSVWENPHRFIMGEML